MLEIQVKHCLLITDLAVGGGRTEATDQHHQASGEFRGADREAGGATGAQATAHHAPRGPTRRPEGLR